MNANRNLTGSKVILIPIDHGNSHIKTDRDVITSGVKVVDEPLDTKNILQMGDGTMYRIGGERMPLQENKVVTPNFYLLTLAMIALEFDRKGITEGEIILATGLPIGRLGSEKKAFRDYLMRNESVSYRYGQKPYRVKIRDVYVYPQCYGAIIEQLPYMKSQEVVVDIGSWTVDTMVFTDHSPNESRCGSDPNGLIPCMRKIEEQCVRKLNSKVGEAVIREVMVTGKADVDQEYIDIIESELKAYTKDVFRIIVEQGVNIKTTPVTFVGGGAALMKRYGEIDQKNVHYIEDIRANAKGYKLIAAAHLKNAGIVFE